MKPWPASFIGAKGNPVNFCRECQVRYRNWSKKTDEEKRVARSNPLLAEGAFRVSFIRSSKNRKLGGIPASITGRGSCPTSCTFYGFGCYAEQHLLARRWREVPERGLDWTEFCEAIAKLPKGQLWRHNEAGDLPGEGVTIDARCLAMLVEANNGRRGFTFSHCPVHRSQLAAAPKGLFLRNQEAILRANAGGFTVNLSADNLAQADALYDLFIGPVAVVLPSDAPDTAQKTPKGRSVVVCPAQTVDGMTCAKCRLCSHADRKAIVGFRAHGQTASTVSRLVQLRRKPMGESCRTGTEHVATT